MPRGGGGGLTCPWRAPTGPAAGWGPPSGPGTLWSAAPADPPSASRSSLHSPSHSPPSSVEQKQSMLGVCLHLLIALCTLCVCVCYLDVFCQAVLCMRVFRHLQEDSCSSSLRSQHKTLFHLRLIRGLLVWFISESLRSCQLRARCVSHDTQQDTQQEDDDVRDAESTLINYWWINGLTSLGNICTCWFSLLLLVIS